ncbi:hypothetical protein C1H76_0869 [Elsinoe australis]|uniref:Uncharacterized protein n=1 Tax=Elsinoe australis TaxID=40998 RepID=A0A4U7B9R3_9PEZI|nr:hypothetical protein C1H76_0869 [Elsinoe australis]
MPSSSTGTTSTELLLRSCHGTITGHLYFHFTSSSTAIPYTLTPHLTDYDTTIPSTIETFLSTLLDAPKPDHPPQADPFVLPTHVHNPHTTYETLTPDAKTAVADIARARPTPTAVLESLAVWMEKVAGTLQQKGRVEEAREAWRIVAGVQEWAGEVEKAGMELEREQERTRRGMEGVCLRWGV